MFSDSKLVALALLPWAVSARSKGGSGGSGSTCNSVVSLAGVLLCDSSLRVTEIPNPVTSTITINHVVYNTVYTTSTATVGPSLTTDLVVATDVVTDVITQTDRETATVDKHTTATTTIELATTETIKVAATVTVDVTAKGKRGLSLCPSSSLSVPTLPVYAEVCGNVAAYESACKNLGGVGVTVTLPACTAFTTATATKTSVVTSTKYTTVKRVESTTTSTSTHTIVNYKTSVLDTTVATATSFITSFKTMYGTNHTVTATETASTVTVKQTCAAVPTAFSLSALMSSNGKVQTYTLGTEGKLASKSSLLINAAGSTKDFDATVFTLSKKGELESGGYAADLLTSTSTIGSILAFGGSSSSGSSIICSIECALNMKCTSPGGGSIFSYCSTSSQKGLYLGKTVPTGCDAVTVKAVSA